MAGTLNTPAYHKLIREDIEWLMKQPRSLERDHIATILEHHLTRTVSQIEFAPTLLAAAEVAVELLSQPHIYWCGGVSTVKSQLTAAIAEARGVSRESKAAN